MSQDRRRESPAERRERHAAVDDPAAVLGAAARFLEPRQRSEAEVRRRLTGAGYRPGLVEDAITRLRELGILDDGGFARTWVESRDRAHPRGEHALRRELALKGIGREAIDEALAERRDVAGSNVDGGPDERAAIALLERRRAGLERIPDQRLRRQRAYTLLVRSGFNPETSARVAAAFVAGVPDDTSPDWGV